MATESRPPLTLPDAVPLAPPAGFAARLAGLGIEVSEAALARIGASLGLLIAANAPLNRTAIGEPAEAWERHALDALTLLPPLAAVPGRGKVVDVGSGGGVPAIPLAIARPDLAFTLVDATQKKGAFLGAVAERLRLTNVVVRTGRAEALARDKALAGRFDAVTARAVARLGALLPLTLPFARPGGLLLLVKGQKAEEELAEAAPLMAERGCRHAETLVTPTGRVVVLRAKT